MPKLTIIIISWNTSKLLRDCLTSIYLQVHNMEFEVIVVDNASHDDSVAMVRREFTQVQTITNAKNLGFSKASNQAIKVSRGRNILLLNSDTVVLTNFKQAVDFLDAHINIGILGVRVLNPDQTIQATCIRQFPTITSKLINYFRLGSKIIRMFIPYSESYQQFDYMKSQPVKMVSGSCMMLPRTIIDHVGMLDESFFLYGEDIDLAQRIHRAGYQVWYSPAASIVHFGGQSSLQVARETHFIRLQSVAKYFDMYHGRAYGNLYRFWMLLIALFGYLPIMLIWAITPNHYHKERLHEFLVVFKKIIRDPQLRLTELLTTNL